MEVSVLAASLAVSVSVWLCTVFSKANNIVTCVCSMWWALATFSPPRLGLTTSGGWTVKLPELAWEGGFRSFFLLLSSVATSHCTQLLLLSCWAAVLLSRPSHFRCLRTVTGCQAHAAHTPLASLPYIRVWHSSLLFRYKPVVLRGGLCVSWRGNVMNIVCSNRQLGESSAGDCC